MTKSEVKQYYEAKLAKEKKCLESINRTNGEQKVSARLREEEIARLEIVVEALKKA